MVNRTTANILLGVLIGGSALIVFDRVRRMRRDEDAEVIARRLAQRLRALESRVSDIASSPAPTRA